MKFLMSVFVFVSAMQMNSAAFAAPTTREVNIAANDIFVPEVLDRASDAKIVLSGMFPNSCYRWSRAEINHVESTFHVIRALAFVTVDTMCLMALVPYSKEVNLGRLQPGEHILRFVSGDSTYFERKVIVN